MEKLNKYLKTGAMQRGLCKEWTESWNMDGDAEYLINKFKAGLDFCIQHDFPSNEFIRGAFSSETLRENHVYVDDADTIESAPSDTYVIQGHSVVELRFSAYSVGTIWVRHASKVRIVADGKAKVFVHLCDNAYAEVVQKGESKMFVKVHSENAVVSENGNVCIRNRNNYND